METFPAASQTPWELIERLIDESDFYVLVIGGKYGSMDEKGISYTEKEYDLAVELNKKIFAFPHASPGKLTVENSETDRAIVEKLEKFREKVSKFHVNTWQNPAELQQNVLASLAIAIFENPDGGWVRVSDFNNPELMAKLLKRQEEIEKLKNENIALRDQLILDSTPPNYAKGEEVVDVRFAHTLSHKDPFRVEKLPKSTVLSWDDLFFCIAEVLIHPSETYAFRGLIGELLLDKIRRSGTYSKPSEGVSEGVVLTKPTLEQLLYEFLALDWVEYSHSSDNGRDRQRWKLTKAGLKKFLTRAAVKSNIANESKAASSSTQFGDDVVETPRGG